MTIETLAKEFEHEVGTTRNHLERLPGDKLDWRPHRKSFTVRGLASHIVECVGWADAVLGKAEVDINPATHKAFEAGCDRRFVDRFRRQGRRWETRAGGRHRGRLAAAMATEDSRPGAVRKAEVDRVSRLLPEPPDSPPRTRMQRVPPAVYVPVPGSLRSNRPTINSDAGIARGGALRGKQINCCSHDQSLASRRRRHPDEPRPRRALCLECLRPAARERVRMDACRYLVGLHDRHRLFRAVVHRSRTTPGSEGASGLRIRRRRAGQRRVHAVQLHELAAEPLHLLWRDGWHRQWLRVYPRRCRLARSRSGQARAGRRPDGRRLRCRLRDSGSARHAPHHCGWMAADVSNPRRGVLRDDDGRDAPAEESSAWLSATRVGAEAGCGDGQERTWPRARC